MVIAVVVMLVNERERTRASLAYFGGSAASENTLNIIGLKSPVIHQQREREDFRPERPR